MLEATPVGNEEIADWIELAVIAGGHKGNTNHKIQKLGSDWTNLNEVQISSGLKVMERRQFLLQDKYPFTVNDLAVVFKENLAISLYTYLLYITRPANAVPWQSVSPTQQESDLFEEVVSLTLKDYLGPASEAIPFGWPSKYGRPEQFPQAIDWLAQKMSVRLGLAFRPPRRKDGGVDVVAWKPFKDRRSGFPIYLVQCTLQREFVSKARDIDLRHWAGWLDMDRDPITILAIPRAIANGELWNEATANSIIFERVRIVDSCNSPLPEGQVEYAEKLLSRFREFASHHLA